MGTTNSAPTYQSRPRASSLFSLGGDNELSTHHNITHTNPPVGLPLDLLAYLNTITSSPNRAYYFKSLKNFNALASTLVLHLGLLPPQDTALALQEKEKELELDEYVQWAQQAIIWSAEILRILREMGKCLSFLQEAKPDDLKGNYHSLEEWEEEVDNAVQSLEGIVSRFKARTGMEKMCALDEVRGIRILTLK